MAGGYQGFPSGTEGFRQWMTDIQRQIDALNGAAGIRSAVIFDPATGSRIRLGDGQIRVWDDFAANPDNYGKIACDPGAGINYFRIFPPYSDGNGLQNSLTIQGRRPGVAGNAWIYTDGQLLFDAEGAGFFDAGTTLRLSSGGRMTIDGDGGIDLLTGGSMRLYELPTTGSAANLRLDPGTVTVQYVTSSRRYKEDIADAAVSPREVLKLQARTWVDKGTADRLAETGEEADIPRNVGFIAEELDALPSMRQFVDYDDQGRPDAIQYDRLTVALLSLAKDQQTQLAAQSAELDAQSAQLASLSARLDALEATS